MLIDAFLYHNERELLDLRIATLKDYVQAFVIVEGDRTFQGTPRKFDFLPLPVNSYRYWAPLAVNAKSPWERESAQRNAIVDAVAQIAPRDHDVVMMSDVDEIPDPNCLEELQREASCGKVVCCRQIHSYYHLNTIVDEAWYGTRALTWRKLCRVDENGEVKGPQDHRNVSHPLEGEHVIGWGGWHFGWIGSNDQVREKVASFSHGDLNRPELVSDHAQDEARRQLRTLHNDQDLHIIGVSRMPKPVQDDPDHYHHLLRS